MAVDEQHQPPVQAGTGAPTVAPAAAATAPPPQAPRAEASTNGDGNSTASGAAPPTPPGAEAVRPVKYRHQWLQTPTHVEVSDHVRMVDAPRAHGKHPK